MAEIFGIVMGSLLLKEYEDKKFIKKHPIVINKKQLSLLIIQDLLSDQCPNRTDLLNLLKYRIEKWDSDDIGRTNQIGYDGIISKFPCFSKYAPHVVRGIYPNGGG